MKQSLLMIAIGVALVGGVLLYANERTNNREERSTERTTREVALACDPQMAEGFHIHTTLEILINGERVPIPPDVGIRETCMTVLHTHTPDGLIHVESPEERAFTLADFFAVWEKPFSKEEILEHKADDLHRVRVTVNGTGVETYENTVLRDGEVIVISYE